jgi:hypothetical protein
VLVADLVGFLKHFPQQPAPGGRVLVPQRFQQRQNEDDEALAQVTVPAETSRNSEEALQPCLQQPGAVARRPVLELWPAGPLTAFHGEQAHADRGAHQSTRNSDRSAALRGACGALTPMIAAAAGTSCLHSTPLAVGSSSRPGPASQ